MLMPERLPIRAVVAEAHHLPPIVCTQTGRDTWFAAA
jgi:hypothetical protein